MPLLLEGPLTLQCHLVGALSLACRVQFWGTTGQEGKDRSDMK